MKHDPIEIYLADSQEVSAKAISNTLLLFDTVTLVRTFSNGKDLLNGCLYKMCNLIVLDLEMPESDGMETLQKLLEITSTPIIMLAVNDELLEECIKHGAKGYLHKNCKQNELQDAIATVMEGNMYFRKTQK